MSGIEVAGLVLGAIPLAVKAFKIYAESVSQVKRYRGYRNHLQDLYQDLDSEYIVYLNTCEQLLDGIVDHNAQKTKLLEDPGGDAWRDPELEEKLKRRLARSYENYMETVQGMKSAVEEIKARLKLGPDGKVQLKNANKFREEIHRIKFSIQKPDYEGLIARITRNNLRLSKLTEQNRSLEESRYPKKRKLPDFSKVQSNARHVYKILSAGLQCGQGSCTTSHTVNLRLECRDSLKLLPLGQQTYYQSAFRVLISYCPNQKPPQEAPWNLEAMDVHPFAEVPRPDPPPPAHSAKKKVAFAADSDTETPPAVPDTSKLLKIENLCREIPRFRSANAGTCVGFLQDQGTSQKIAIFPTSLPVNLRNTPSSFLPLRTIFSDGRPEKAPISWADKLRVAVVIASSILQLHETPWLHDEWSMEDIKILSDAEADICNYLFLSRTCDASTDHPGSMSWVGPCSVFRSGVRCQKLFALGILLIELCFGKPFHDLRRQSPLSSEPEPSGLSDLTIADEYVDWCYLEKGNHYGDVVRRCIRCSFDTRKADLGDAQFRSAVYEGVLGPLQEDLRNFSGLSS